MKTNVTNVTQCTLSLSLWSEYPIRYFMLWIKIRQQCRLTVIDIGHKKGQSAMHVKVLSGALLHFCACAALCFENIETKELTSLIYTLVMFFFLPVSLF